MIVETEKLCNKLYEWVIKERVKGNYEKFFDLNCDRFNTFIGYIYGIMFSKTLKALYSIPSIGMIIFLI